jgi:site-specific recombinase XerD
MSYLVPVLELNQDSVYRYLSQITQPSLLLQAHAPDQPPPTSLGCLWGLTSNRPLPRANAFHMIQRRAKEAEIQTAIGCHTFRATVITIYLLNGGSLEKAQMMAAHESPRATKLYDRTSNELSLDEVERMVF